MTAKVFRAGLFALVLLAPAGLALAAIGMRLQPGSSVGASVPGAAVGQRMQAVALEEAVRRGLQGEPTAVTTKRITLREFNLRLDPLSREAAWGGEHTADALGEMVWLTAIRGKVVSEDSAPLQDGGSSYTVSDNMWVSLNADGQPNGWGILPPGQAADLEAPLPAPITTWPEQTERPPKP